MDHNAPPRGRPGSGERGAGALEWVATMLLASMLVSALALITTPDIPGKMAKEVRRAICMVSAIVDLPCSESDTEADDTKPEPTEPCVQNVGGANGSTSVSFLFVKLGKGMGLFIETLSDGTYRVTKFYNGEAGATAGAGGSIGVTYDDLRLGYGASASASAGYIGEFGEVYEVGSKSEMEQLVNSIKLEQASNSIIPGLSWLTNGVSDAVTGYERPAPVSVYGQAGKTGEASAQYDQILVGGSASASMTQVLGAAANSDGTTTVYYDGEVEGSVNADVMVALGTTVGGSVGQRIAVTLDANGEVQSMSVTYTYGGQVGSSVDERNEMTFELDAKSDADRKAMLEYLVNPSAFLNAAMDHGTATKVKYDTSQNTDVTGTATVGEGAEVGVDAEVHVLNENVSEALYWNGKEWAPWTACR